jgi:molybdate transport system substrate-binding protein
VKSSRRLGIRLAAMLVLLAGPTIALAAGKPMAELRVFAAASLADAFAEIARGFERGHPGIVVHFQLAGSQQLAFQLEQGAAADVFASADERWMIFARERSLLAGEAAVFASNALVVIVPRANPARIGALRDLSRRGVKLVIGADAVPVGRYSREMLQALPRVPGFAPDFATRVLANVVSEEENVRSVVGKVQLGEADAGIVYRSDITPAVSRFVRRFEIPAEAQVLARYPIAVLRDARQAAAARAFVALVLSSDGQRVLERRGLIPAAATP